MKTDIIPNDRTHIPMALKRRGGRKLIITPDGAVDPTAPARIDDTLIKALGRAWRWQLTIYQFSAMGC
ncbi:MAG: hypothetical protein FD149_2286 [Rhodospirillaceae bacterium]|nr:MAG: hypothetical protein FD149_2286 [Rhodospirillaceae bacterium]